MTRQAGNDLIEVTCYIYREVLCGVIISKHYTYSEKYQKQIIKPRERNLKINFESPTLHLIEDEHRH